MKYNLISRYGFHPVGRTFTEPSQFVPDRSLSVQEILRRYATGAITDDVIVRDHQYGDDISPDEDFDNMDPRYDPDYDMVDAFEEANTLETARNSLNKEVQAAKTNRTSRRPKGGANAGSLADESTPESTDPDDAEQ